MSPAVKRRARELTRHRPTLADDREREIAGLIGGALYVSGAGLVVILAVTVATQPALMGVTAGVSLLLGLAMIAAPWSRLPGALMPWISACAVALYGVVTVLAGGIDSPAVLYAALVTVYACAFYSPRAALAVTLGVTAVGLLPLVYDDTYAQANLTELLLTVFVQLGLGLAVILGSSAVRQLAWSQQRLAREQAALLDLAKDVASERDAIAVFTQAARDSARLLGAHAGGVMKYIEEDGEERVIIVAGWGEEGMPHAPAGTIVPGGSTTILGRVRRSGVPARERFGPDEGGIARELGYQEMAVAPVRAGGRIWGAIGLVVQPGGVLEPDAPERLADFADLISTAVANEEARSQLVDQATLDPLTGLFNHRAFHEQLRTELARAQRYGRALALAVIDVDHFKAINDAAGHDVGDQVLAAVAERLQEAARTEDTLARIGGDEFAMLLPEADSVRAFAAIERGRTLISGKPVLPGISVTVSAGICDLANAQDADTMFRLADGALYWSKAHGRDSSWIYDPDVVQELSAAERAEQLRRSQALLGIRALARAIDAKDPSTQRHSERVAALSRRLAEALEWDPARAALLEEAALVHDVGKIGVPDAVLLKPGRLTAHERTLVGKHAELGARIVEDVLTEEQVEWIRSHHERPDGHGYPRGLAGAQLSAGAAILTVADSFDVMTMSRPYSAAKPMSDAIAECEGLIGRQFVAAPVEALIALQVSGELADLMCRAEGEDPGDVSASDQPPARPG
ncbi:MAG: diguanylate cyclase [Solirubrobacteraceae bacterium]|nr:diguanylate cyclase [Solirubrobacteraceae bacterium]